MRYLILALVMSLGCSDDSSDNKGVFIPDGQPDMSVDQAQNDLAFDAVTDVANDPVAVPDMLECDSDGGACPLTCEVLADPGFCWNIARLEANACGDSENHGVMSGDGLRCTSQEIAVEFSEAVLQAQVTDRELWDFKISRGGKTCLDLHDDETSLSVSTRSGTTGFELTEEPSFVYRMTCPNGSSWEATDRDALLLCRDSEGLTTLPGRSVVTVGSDFQFGLLPGPDSLFWCGF